MKYVYMGVGYHVGCLVVLLYISFKTLSVFLKVSASLSVCLYVCVCESVCVCVLERESRIERA